MKKLLLLLFIPLLTIAQDEKKSFNIKKEVKKVFKYATFYS